MPPAKKSAAAVKSSSAQSKSKSGSGAARTKRSESSDPSDDDSGSDSASDGGESKPAVKRKSKPKPKPKPKSKPVAKSPKSSSEEEEEGGSGSGSVSESDDKPTQNPKQPKSEAKSKAPTAATHQQQKTTDTASSSVYRATVPSAHHNSRLDAVVPKLIVLSHPSAPAGGELTRSFLQKLMKSESVSVNGQTVDKAGLKLRTGDKIVVTISSADSARNSIIALSHAAMADLARAAGGNSNGSHSSGGGGVQEVRQSIRGEAIRLDIVYEDEWLLVVNKPQGMVVHPSVDSASHFTGTLVNALIHHCGTAGQGLSSPPDDPMGIRPGIVHRIDRDTSGLLVIAKTNAVHAHLKQQFTVHSIVRRYNCLVSGAVKSDAGTLHTLIGRHPTDRKRRAVIPSDLPLPLPSAVAAGDDDEEGGGGGGGGGAGGPKVAITHYRVLERYLEEKKSGSSGSGGAAFGLSLVECTLETGRTHQVRVHMKHLTHPILNDPDYGTGSSAAASSKKAKGLAKAVAAVLESARPQKAQMLHARVIGFIHPISQLFMQFESPLPPLFQQIRETAHACLMKPSTAQTEYAAKTAAACAAALVSNAKSIAALTEIKSKTQSAVVNTTVSAAPAPVVSSNGQDPKIADVKQSPPTATDASATKSGGAASPAPPAPAAAVRQSTTRYEFESSGLEPIAITELTSTGVVGHTVWRASFVLAKYFERYKPALRTLIAHPQPTADGAADSKTAPAAAKSKSGGSGRARWIELGAGTGLLSVVLQRLGCRVLTTDCADVMKLLHSNIARKYVPRIHFALCFV